MRPGFPYGPCSHTFPRLPNTTARLQKSRHWFRRDQRPAPQISNQSNPNRYPEPTLHLRKPSANQFQQILHACEGGGGTFCAHVFTGMRTLSCLHGHARIHGHGYTFTGMRTPSRVCARLHGHAHARVQLSHFHAHTCTAMAISGHAFDETSVRLAQIKLQSNSLKFQRPTTGGHGRQGTASLRDATASASLRRQWASTCMYDRA